MEQKLKLRKIILFSNDDRTWKHRKKIQVSLRKVHLLFVWIRLLSRPDKSIKQQNEKKENGGDSLGIGQLIGRMCAEAAGLCGEDFEQFVDESS